MNYRLKSFPCYHQLDSMDCGPTCLRIIAKYYGRNFSLQKLRDKCFATRNGVSLLGISDAAESIGFRTQGVKITFSQLVNELPLPAIVHWDQNHFVVCYGIKKKWNNAFDRRECKYELKISDPDRGKFIIDKFLFLDSVNSFLRSQPERI